MLGRWRGRVHGLRDGRHGCPETRGSWDLRLGQGDIAVPAMAKATGPSPLNKHIQQLKEQQAALKTQKKALQKNLRNAERKRRRLRERARQLTDDDLVSVLLMRQEKQKEDISDENGHGDEDSKSVEAAEETDEEERAG